MHIPTFSCLLSPLLWDKLQRTCFTAEVLQWNWAPRVFPMLGNMIRGDFAQTTLVFAVSLKSWTQALIPFASQQNAQSGNLNSISTMWSQSFFSVLLPFAFIVLWCSTLMPFMTERRVICIFCHNTNNETDNNNNNKENREKWRPNRQLHSHLRH